VRLPPFFASEEQQYAPFVAGALSVAVLAGFPLGLTLAVASARESTLDGHRAALAQVHGHLQLAGWFGLFVVGMGYRLAPRFTGARLRALWPVPVTFSLYAAGLVLRAVSQPWMDRSPFDVLAVISAVFELAGAGLFASVIWRCLRRGRPDEFGFKPYFATGAAWLVIAMVLDLLFVVDAAGGTGATLPVPRNSAVTYALLYGFILSFILGVSLRTFPVFFGRKPVSRGLSGAVLGTLTAGVAAYVAGAVWHAEEATAGARTLYDAGALVTGAGMGAAVLGFGVLRGAPHRLRPSARRSMVFVRAGYAWLLAAGALQAYYAGRAIAEERFVAYYEADALRHLVALGFATTVLFGVSLMVLPRLAVRRVTGRSVQVVISGLLALVQTAAVTRSAGSILVNELRFKEGFWTMSAGGAAGLLAVLLFAAYLLQDPGQIEIPVTSQRGRRADG